MEKRRGAVNKTFHGRTSSKLSMAATVRSSTMGLPSSKRPSDIDHISTGKSGKFGSSPPRRSSSVRVQSADRGLTSSVLGPKRCDKATLGGNASKRSLVHTSIPNELETECENTLPEKQTNSSTTKTDRSESSVDTMTSGKTILRPSSASISASSSRVGLPLSLRSSQLDLVSSQSSSQIGSLQSRRSNSIRKTSSDSVSTSLPRGSKRFSKPNLNRTVSKRHLVYSTIPNELETASERSEYIPPEKQTNISTTKTDTSESAVDAMTSGKTVLRPNSASESTSPSRISLSLPLPSSQLDLVSSGRSSQIESLQSRRSSGMTSSDSVSTSLLRGSKRFSKPNLNRNVSKRSLISADTKHVFETKSNNSLPEELEIFIDRCNDMEKTAIQNIKKVEQSHSGVTAEIKKFRKQVNDVLDVWEKEALEKVDDIMKGDIANLNSVLDECAHLIEEILQPSKEVTEYRTKLFEVNVIGTEAKNTYREYKFISNDNISNLLKGECQIGEVKITCEVAGLYNNLENFDKFVPTYLEEINVKAENDSFDCDITGMAMIGAHKLIVSDTDNKSVKSVDTKLKKVTSHLNFSSGPWDLTRVSRGQVAVTIPSEKIIQFVISTPGLVLGRYLKVNGECHGIAYRQECLIVSFRSPGKVQIMNLQGNVLKTINQYIHKAKRHVFHWPDYIAVSKDESSIYVSDCHRNTITRLSWKGEVTGVYTEKRGTKMAGIAVANDGSVLVCKRTSHSIVKLDADCTTSSTILEEKHGLKYPWSLCFCDEESKLYVDNNRNSNTVAVFELK